MQLTNVTLSSRADGGQELKSEVEMKIAEAHAEQLSLIKAKVKEQARFPLYFSPLLSHRAI
jgi:hypothetical protein